MLPGTIQLVVYRGDTYTWQFTLWADAAKTQPVDLTGVTVASEIRTQPGGALITALHCAVQLPNVITAAIDHASSMLLMPPVASWDLQLTFPTGEVATVVSGTVAVVMDVTGSAPASLKAVA